MARFGSFTTKLWIYFLSQISMGLCTRALCPGAVPLRQSAAVVTVLLQLPHTNTPRNAHSMGISHGNTTTVATPPQCWHGPWCLATSAGPNYTRLRLMPTTTCGRRMRMCRWSLCNRWHQEEEKKKNANGGQNQVSPTAAFRHADSICKVHVMCVRVAGIAHALDLSLFP